MVKQLFSSFSKLSNCFFKNPIGVIYHFIYLDIIERQSRRTPKTGGKSMTRGCSWLSYNLILDGFHGVSLLVFEAFSKTSSAAPMAIAMNFMAVSFSSLPSIPPPPHSLIPLRLASSHRFPTFSPGPRIRIQCATKDNKEATPPAAASTESFDPKKGVALYKPKSYDVLVTDAANSLAYAIQDGKTRLEIDFPYVSYLPIYLWSILIFLVFF